MKQILPPRVRRVLRVTMLRTGLVAASLLLATGCAEMAVRVLAPQQLIQIRPDLYRPADTVGWLHRPNTSVDVNTGERTVHVYTDDEGFRVGEDGPAQQGAPVLLLGDSFMEALQVDYEVSFAGRLQALLPDAAGEPVAIRNAGMSGWGPNQYAARARDLLPGGRFRLVIVGVFVGNDAQPVRIDYVPPHEPVARHGFRIPRRLSGSEIVDAVLRPLNDMLEERSHLFILLRSSLEVMRMRLGVSPLYMPEEFMRREARGERWAIAAEYCRDIANLAAREGTRTLFVLIPEGFQVDEARFARYLTGFGVDSADVDLEQPTRLLRDELESRGLHVLDVLAEFRAAHDAGRRLYGQVDPHLSPEGHQLLAALTVPEAAALLRESARP